MDNPQGKLLFPCCLSHHCCLLLPFPLPGMCLALKPWADIPRVTHLPPFIRAELANLNSGSNSLYTFFYPLWTCPFGPRVNVDSALENGVIQKVLRQIFKTSWMINHPLTMTSVWTPKRLPPSRSAGPMPSGVMAMAQQHHTELPSPVCQRLGKSQAREEKAGQWDVMSKQPRDCPCAQQWHDQQPSRWRALGRPAPAVGTSPNTGAELRGGSRITGQEWDNGAGAG